MCFYTDAVKQIIHAGVQAINQPNKLLKIADRHCWDTVREYSANPLADDDAAKLRGVISSAVKYRIYKSYDKNGGINQQLHPQQPSQQQSHFEGIRQDFTHLTNHVLSEVFGNTGYRKASL